MSHRTARALLPLTAVLGLAAAAIFGRILWSSSAAAATDPVPSSVLATVLHRVGLDPQALATAGVSSQSTTSVVNAVRTYLAQYPTTISSADVSYQSARQSSDQLERTVQSGLATSQQKSDFQSSKSTLTSAASSRQSALDAAFNAGVAVLSAGQQATLAKIRANRSWQLDLPYLVADRSEADWIKLREALAAKRIAEKEGEQTPSGSAALLASEDGVSAVATAKTSLATNGASVTSAWNQAVGG